MSDNEKNETLGTRAKKATFLKKLNDFLLFFESNISGIALGLLALVVFYGVLLRYVFHMPNSFGEELARYLFLVCVYFGLSAGVALRSHLGVTTFLDMMPAKLSRALRFLASIVTICTYIYLIYISVIFTKLASRLKQTSVAMKIPMTAMYSLLILCFVLCTIRSLMLFWSDYFDKSASLEESREEVML